MMRYTILLFAFVLAISFANAQTTNAILVKYKEHIANMPPVISVLLADKSNAVFPKDTLPTLKETITSEEGTNNIHINSNRNRDSKLTIYSSAYNDARYMVVMQPKKDTLIIVDSVPAMQWQLTNSTKKIGNYVCKSATLKFRGSNVTAYYTTELPYTFGPFKFKGLPGLILAVYEDPFTFNNVTYTNSWEAETIIYPYPAAAGLLSFNTSGKKTITMKEATAMGERETKIMRSKIESSALPGLLKREYKTQRTGVEKKYEWEN